MTINPALNGIDRKQRRIPSKWPAGPPFESGHRWPGPWPTSEWDQLKFGKTPSDKTSLKVADLCDFFDGSGAS
ncbi:hypothetical protein [Sphingomonas sp. UYP23]